MLVEGDLEKYIEYFETARKIESQEFNHRIENILSSNDTGLKHGEIWRLGRSIKIAIILGDCSNEHFVALELIREQVSDKKLFAGFENEQAWVEAIHQTLASKKFTDRANQHSDRVDRQTHVGNSLLKLRKANYEVGINAYGAWVSETSQLDISRKISTLISLIGGIEFVSQIFVLLSREQKHKKGFWLFGNSVPSIHNTGNPFVPYSWLVSLGLKQLHKKRITRNPDKVWKNIIELAVNFASAIDCQRYSQYEEMTGISPDQFHRVIRDTLIWHEIFCIPQVTRSTIIQLKKSLSEIMNKKDEEALGFSIEDFFSEALHLINRASDQKVSVLPRKTINKETPIMLEIAFGRYGQVNKQFIEPRDSEKINQGSYLIYEAHNQQVAILPLTLTCAAVCEVLFRSIVTKIKKNRADVIKKEVFEIAIKNACLSKTSNVFFNEEYYIGKKPLEIDVATREGDKIVIFETKAKSLTAKAKSGNFFSFLKDYNDSFLHLLEQLTRHEIHIRDHKTQITSSKEDAHNLKPLKIAVSPITYGPMSDHVLAINLIQSIAASEFVALEPNENNEHTISNFNARKKRVIEQISQLAPRKENMIELHPYLMDVFWLDLGQLLYLLDSSKTVADAFKRIQFVTYSTRDFWTEIAYREGENLKSARK